MSYAIKGVVVRPDFALMLMIGLGVLQLVVQLVLLEMIGLFVTASIVFHGGEGTNTCRWALRCGGMSMIGEGHVFQGIWWRVRQPLN